MGIILVLLLALVSGCAHIQKKDLPDPKTLATQACTPGSKNKIVKGSVWLKAQSKDASGQFPALVEARSPASLNLEVTNLLGGTEANITINGRHYKISSPNKKIRTEKGTDSWAGIPLHWATDLFLGKIPCPSTSDLKSAVLTINDDGELVIDTQKTLGSDAQEFVFGFRRWGDRFWAEKLRWESKGALASRVDFKFEEPEETTGSPKKWEAKSSQGEVKVRWKEKSTNQP